MSPISPFYDRGKPIDRYYIERFLSVQASEIKGHVLEIGDDFYTQRFGGTHVVRSDVLHVVEGNPRTTIVADLTRDHNIPSNTFDCIIFTQTLQMIYDVRKALQSLYHILKPGGVLLLTSHGISKICRHEGVDSWGEYWHFTTQSMRHLFKETFPAADVTIKAFGNVLSAIAFLHGLGTQELSRKELDYSDPNYEVLITVKAVKARARRQLAGTGEKSKSARVSQGETDFERRGETEDQLSPSFIDTHDS